MQKITAYRDGHFTEEDEPEWWKDGTARFFDSEAPSAGNGEAFYGDTHGNNVDVHSLAETGHGFIVFMADTLLTFTVWIPTTADYLDFLTNRVSQFIGLGSERPLAASLDTLCNAFIAYVRHGEGDHINRTDGVSRIDRIHDRETQLRQRAKGSRTHSTPPIQSSQASQD